MFDLEQENKKIETRRDVLVSIGKLLYEMTDDSVHKSKLQLTLYGSDLLEKLGNFLRKYCDVTNNEITEGQVQLVLAFLSGISDSVDLFEKNKGWNG